MAVHRARQGTQPKSQYRPVYVSSTWNMRTKLICFLGLNVINSTVALSQSPASEGSPRFSVAKCMSTNNPTQGKPWLEKATHRAQAKDDEVDGGRGGQHNKQGPQVAVCCSEVALHLCMVAQDMIILGCLAANMCLCLSVIKSSA